jgi:hypothetical protein
VVAASDEKLAVTLEDHPKIESKTIKPIFVELVVSVSSIFAIEVTNVLQAIQIG